MARRVLIGMTEAHAQFLMDVLQAIGGSPVLSRRKYADDLIAILNEAGFETRFPAGSGVSFVSDFQRQGTLTFGETPDFGKFPDPDFNRSNDELFGDEDEDEFDGVDFV